MKNRNHCFFFSLILRSYWFTIKTDFNLLSPVNTAKVTNNLQLRLILIFNLDFYPVVTKIMSK